jgi:indolepyruvate ferredoxin oxidoreductase alpha subunit
VDAALDAALAADGPAVIVARRPCVLKRFSRADRAEFDLSPKRCTVDPAACTKCKLCAKTGCPAIYTAETVRIDRASCTGCGLCAQICPFRAIREERI